MRFFESDGFGILYRKSGECFFLYSLLRDLFGCVKQKGQIFDGFV
jgi:hypothetical protein